MMKMSIFTILFSFAAMLSGCRDEIETYESGDMSVRVEQGENWLHDFPLFLGFKKKNPPQIAIWTETMEGHYLQTIYVTRKCATAGWVGAGDNRRKEALPRWCHQRGVKAEDGLYCPSRQMPLTDALTGATPHEGFSVKLTDKSGMKRFKVVVEVNHSTDFNSLFCKGLSEGDANYSGGDKGSGQPAVVYEAAVCLDSPQREFTASLVGHSSPDGSDGRLYTDIDGLTTARSIVKRITITLR